VALTVMLLLAQLLVEGISSDKLPTLQSDTGENWILDQWKRHRLEGSSRRPHVNISARSEEETPLFRLREESLPSVSLIMPTNGRPEFVVRALDMIMEAQYPMHLLEAIVVDDSSERLRVKSLKPGAQTLPWKEVKDIPPVTDNPSNKNGGVNDVGPAKDGSDCDCAWARNGNPCQWGNDDGSICWSACCYQRRPGGVQALAAEEQNSSRNGSRNHSKNSTHAGLKVTYVVLDQMISIGAKRNIACEHAKNEIIIHWDDDDVYSPERISTQVGPMIEGRYDITMMEHQATYFMDMNDLVVADVRWKDISSWGPHFGTLAYRRSLWGANGVRFTDNSEAEDYGFAQNCLLGGARIKVLPSLGKDGTLLKFAWVHHGTNTYEWGKTDCRSVPPASLWVLLPPARRAQRLLRWMSASSPLHRLSGNELAFSSKALHGGLLERLAYRRDRNKPIHRWPNSTVQQEFFGYLYLGEVERARFVPCGSKREREVRVGCDMWRPYECIQGGTIGQCAAEMFDSNSCSKQCRHRELLAPPPPAPRQVDE
jgi:hypothetical protein